MTQLPNQEPDTDERLAENGLRAPRLWGWHTYVSLAVSFAVLAAMAMMVDLRDAWQSFLDCDKRLVLLALLAHYATYPVRGARWRRSLNHLGSKAGVSKFGLVIFFYNFVDNLVPAKLGDLYGAHLARINFGIRRSAALGSMVFLRMIDSWVILFLAVACSWVLFSSRLPEGVVWGLVAGLILALGVTGVLAPFVLLGRATPRWIPAKVQDMVRSFQTGMWPSRKEVVPIGLLTAAIWSLETAWIYLLVLAFGVNLGLAQAIFLTQLPLLATAFPLTPSGVGAVEATLYGCLRILAISHPLAVSITVLNRCIDYWLHIGLGIITWGLRDSLGLKAWRTVPLEPEQSDEVEPLGLAELAGRSS